MSKAGEQDDGISKSVRPVGRSLASLEVPQVSLDLVLFVLAFIAANGRRPKQNEEGVPHDQRQLNYAHQAAGILGLFVGDRITEAGHVIVTLVDKELQLLRLAFAFESSAVGQRWIEWSGAKELADVDPRTAPTFLKECAENADTETASRRASTIKSWANEFQRLRNRYAGQSLEVGGWAQFHKPSEAAFDEQNIFDEGGSDRVLRALIEGTRELRVASGFFTISGYLRLIESTNERLRVQLLIGDDDRNPFGRRSESDAATILSLFQASLGRGILDSRRRQDTRRMYKDLLRTIVKIRHFEPRKLKGLHAKVYLFDKRAAYVTSANLTLRGLQHSIEAGRVLREPDVDHFLKRFDVLFGEAKPLSSGVLRAIEESWAFRRPVTPYQIFLKVMHEIYDRLPQLRNDSKKPLADFQRRVVTPVLSKLLSFRGTLLVAPTGTGKTTMATYVAAYLWQERHIQSIYILCPNDEIARKWRDEMGLFELEPHIVSHSVIRRRDEDLSLESQQIKQQLRIPRADRLIIVDECHHFRGEQTSGWKSLSEFMFADDIGEKRPFALLLTATPFSIGKDDLNAMLKLIRQCEITTLDELEKRYAVVVVTLPFILTHYGRQVPGGRGLALRFGEFYLYYPELHIQTESYPFVMDEALSHIESLHLEFIAGASVAVTETAIEEDVPYQSRNLQYGPMLRKNLARRAESSPNALRASIHRLRQGIETGKLVPVDKLRLLGELVALERHLDTLPEDKKLGRLLELLRKLGKNRKALIFSEAVATVQYLAEQISRAFRKCKVRFLVGETPDAERRKILAAFPESIDILVSSNASSEGVDLPGAQLVVNYDLSWTPLTLAQRIGRIDRPRQQPHKVFVQNFYPGPGSFERLVGLGDRLEDRATKLAAVTMTNVFGSFQRSATQSREDELGFVRALYEQGGFDWRSLGDLLPTPEYLQIWLAAPSEDLREAASLPDGIQCGERRGASACYVLVRYEDRSIALIKDRKSEIIQQAPAEVSHELLVNDRIFAKADTPGTNPPSCFDDEVADVVRTWALSRKIDFDDITIVASKHLEQ